MLFILHMTPTKLRGAETPGPNRLRASDLLLAGPSRPLCFLRRRLTWRMGGRQVEHSRGRRPEQVIHVDPLGLAQTAERHRTSPEKNRKYIASPITKPKSLNGVCCERGVCSPDGAGM